MKNNLRLLSIFTILLIAGLTGCSRYEDGPDVSLLTRKMRITNTWKIESVTNLTTGVTTTTGYDDISETYEDDGTYRYNFGSVSLNGTWEFSGTNGLRVTVGSTSDTDEILRLTNKELWILDDEANDEVHYYAD